MFLFDSREVTHTIYKMRSGNLNVDMHSEVGAGNHVKSDDQLKKYKKLSQVSNSKSLFTPPEEAHPCQCLSWTSSFPKD